MAPTKKKQKIYKFNSVHANYSNLNFNSKKQVKLKEDTQLAIRTRELVHDDLGAHRRNSENNSSDHTQTLLDSV